MASPLFCIAKKRKAEEKRKEKLLRGCHQGQNVTVLAILGHLIIQKIFFPANHGGRQYFSVFHGPCFLNTISPKMWQYYREAPMPKALFDEQNI